MTQDEKAIIGQMLLDESVYHDCGLRTAQFSESFGRRVHSAISDLVARGVKPDIMTVTDSIGFNHAADISSLTSMVGSAANWMYYRDRVRNDFRRRELTRLSSVVKDCADEPDTALEKIEDRLIAIYSDANDGEVVEAKLALRKVVDRTEERFKRKGELPGIATGITDLDALILGFEASKLYYVGGRPSMGKSALVGNFAVAAANAGKRVGIISLESADTELMTRLLAAETNVDSRNLSTGNLHESDFGRLMDAAGKIADWPMWIYDNPNATLEDIRRRMRQMVLYHKVEIIFLDYLQLITPSGRTMEFREHVARCSTALKGAARSLRIPVVATAQLRRDTQTRRPNLADFSETSQIEKDADVAILIHRDDEANYWLLTDKNRDGRTGDVPVTFLAPTVRFVARAPERE